MNKNPKNIDRKNQKTERKKEMQRTMFIAQLKNTLSEMHYNAFLFAQEAKFHNLKTFFQTQTNKKSIQFSFIIVQED